ncbi:FecCD family ABC transporter permease [Ornithinimicrobium flavum]|uniref:FecCD family ABC transporter permease n=1 Tax=Ornithinimicrobium flavum TaxID=1288636 RepID=UPI00106FFD41|nr:iron ABC transporter permease [Ornithinimicrobium flavum]
MRSRTPTPEAQRAPDALEASVARAFRRPVAALLGCVALLVLAILASASQGAAGLPVEGVVRSLVGAVPGLDVEQTLTTQQEQVLWQIRLPRTMLAALVGGSLAVAGAGYQGVFRNPLADPYLLGVSAGAGLGAVLALGFGLDLSWGPIDALPMAAFLGAVLAVIGSVLVARASFRDPATLLLAGVAMAALFSASQTYALTRLDETRAREVLSWLFGRLATHGWQPVGMLVPYVVLAGAVLVLHARHLDVLRLGDDEARSLGLKPARSRLVVVTAATLITAAAVSVSGLIAFVGLVTPHVVRLLVGHSYRLIVPLSAVLGATFLAFVDIGARTLVAPAELPVGVITAFIGAPFFSFVLWRGKANP